jgi:excisionase family DNA binding protein
MKPYTAKEVADLIGRTTDTVYRWVREGYIPHIRLRGGSLIFPKQEVDAWLDEKRNTVAAADQAIENLKRALQSSNQTPGWVYDARRWFAMFGAADSYASMSADQLKALLQMVRPVRDAIFAYEQRYVQLKGEA